MSGEDELNGKQADQAAACVDGQAQPQPQAQPQDQTQSQSPAQPQAQDQTQSQSPAQPQPQDELQPQSPAQPQPQDHLQLQAPVQPPAQDQTQSQPHRQQQASRQEKISYTTPDGRDVEVPIVRANMPDLFIALQPPRALPYIMAGRDEQPQKIVDFFAAHVNQVEELRADMLKRFAKSDSLKCRYQTGDVAYVMGRPFQLRVYPLGSSKERPKSGMRGRTTSKFSIDYAISLLTLYVMHPRNYDEAKRAFRGYAERVITTNAKKLSTDFFQILAPGQNPPTVRLRAMRDRWSSDEAGALWLSEDLIPYPPDCLVYVLWRELEKRATIPPDEVAEHFERVLPGWQNARRILTERSEPYSLQ